VLKLFTYLRNVYLSRCCEQGWRAYVRKGDGKWVRADPGKKTEGPHYDAFIADPFLFHHKGTNWLFYETVGPERVASGLKGKIGCFKEVGGKWINQGIVLENPWHMSYPQVFEEDGHIYMIPEQSALGKGDVSLYEATDFPRGWVRRATLIDRPFADATLLRKDGHYYMACYTIPPHETAELWHAPSLLGPWERHPQWQNINQDAKYRRCGGSFLNPQPSTLNPQPICRIAQDCEGGYGIRLYKVPVLKVTPEKYQEGDPIPFLDENAFPRHHFKHTYNEIMTGGQKLSVLDCQWRTLLPVGTMVRNLFVRVSSRLNGAGHD